MPELEIRKKDFSGIWNGSTNFKIIKLHISTLSKITSRTKLNGLYKPRYHTTETEIVEMVRNFWGEPFTSGIDVVPPSLGFYNLFLLGSANHVRNEITPDGTITYEK